MALIKSNVQKLKQTLVTTITIEQFLREQVVGKVPEKMIRLEALDPYNVQTAIVCPFHDDNKPSMTVYHRRQDWYCFGSCRTGGDVVNLYQHTQKSFYGKEINYLKALEGLADLYGIPYEPLFVNVSQERFNATGITMKDITGHYKEREAVPEPKEHWGTYYVAKEHELIKLKREDKALWIKKAVELDYLMSLGLPKDELCEELREDKK